MKKIEKHNLFALDALGAFMSIFYLFLIYYFDAFFGMPTEVVIVFLGIAITFAFYSTAMYLIKPVNWPFYLTIIAFLNYGYCLYTMYHVIRNLKNLTIFGLIYFVLEIIVIIILATYELGVARKAQELD